jgi:hypothetical protein
MTISVVIDDYIQDRRTSYIFTEQQMDIIRGHWSNRDKLLVDLSTTEYFKNKTRWCDLDPVHYKIMILRNLIICQELNQTENISDIETAERSLQFLIGAMINAIQIKCECRLDLLKIQRVNDRILNFDFQANLILEIESNKQQESTKPPFKIVIDNTKNETDDTR